MASQNGQSVAGENPEARIPLNISSPELLKILPAAIYTCDLEGRVTFYNQAAADLWGRAPELNKDLWCGSFKIFRTDGSNLPLEECPMAQVLKQQVPVKSQEIVVERPDGTRKNVMVHPQLTRDSKGRPTGAINMLIDITDKKHNEEALRESESKYRKLTQMLELKVEERTQTLKLNEQRYHKMVEEVQDYAIMLLDLDGTILNWNKGIHKIKGYSEKEITGQNFRIFYLPEDLERNLPERLLQTALEEGRAMHEGWRLKKDGGKFWGSIVLTLLNDEKGEPIGFSKVTRDLTERKKAEDRMVEYARDIESRNRQLEEYAHVASHDLQEPLRKVQIFSDMLQDSLDDKESATRYLEMIKKAANRMSSLIKDVLLYSEANNFEELYRKIDLNDILANVKEDLSLLIQEKEAKISHDDLPEVDGIPVQIHQLFSNLLGNALKFASENPEIRITAGEHKGSPEKDIPGLKPGREYIKLVFKDNGIGFDPIYAESIFTLFKRLNHKALGNGIGLPLCKKIVEIHGGRITVDSAPRKGTTFTIYLPVKHIPATKPV